MLGWYEPGPHGDWLDCPEVGTTYPTAALLQTVAPPVENVTLEQELYPVAPDAAFAYDPAGTVLHPEDTAVLY